MCETNKHSDESCANNGNCDTCEKNGCASTTPEALQFALRDILKVHKEKKSAAA